MLRQEGMAAKLLLVSVISTEWELLSYFEKLSLYLSQSFVPQKSSYIAKGGHFGPFVNAGIFSKKPTAKIRSLALSKKGREKMKWLR